MLKVSTHSRLKAAGAVFHVGNNANGRFNTQPPEGGWRKHLYRPSSQQGFNTQPPEGGWARENFGFDLIPMFQHTAA